MTRETAVTEEITYDTQNCKICETEVATDSAAPLDTFEPHGHAVILGEGKFQQKIEHQGNWDRELYFELEKEDTQLPTVEGYIICEDCAQSIHQHPETAGKYTGRIPSALRSTNIDGFSVDETTAVIILAILLLLLIFSVLL